MNDVFNDNALKRLYRFLTNRLLILFIFFCIMFYILVARLFKLQIVEGETYLNSLVFTTLKTLTIPAPRGTIFDRYGRPLAINTSAFTVKIDPSVQVDMLNDMLYDLIKVFERHGQDYVDELPISNEEPYTFRFNDSASREKTWKDDMDIPESLNAQECFDYLRDKFKISPELSNVEARKIMQLRAMLYMQRYRQYKPITIAYGVERALVITLEEENNKFPGVYIDVESLREYPYGEQFAHIIGYIRRISDTELEANKGKGYTNTDLYGKTGIELAFESNLKGTNGEMVIEVDNQGRRVRTVSVEEPIQGDKIFLTLDQRLTEETYKILEDTLVEILKNKLQGKSNKEKPITQKDFFISMLWGNSISIRKIMESHKDSFTSYTRDYILDNLPDAGSNYATEEGQKRIKEVLEIGISNDTITSTQMIFTLYELDVITLSDEYIERLKNGKLPIMPLILEKLDSGEITPQMTNLDPCTGSVIITDIKTGDVLASVGYPTYDNNELVNSFNNEYYAHLISDPNAPMWNRPFLEARAPGSTFKMLTAVAALELGAITPTKTYYDAIHFTDAGYPYARCYSSYSHGFLNVAHALEVSCNYFFCQAAYNLGNAKSGTEKESIAGLNQYMTLFGFNDRTGVEIGERRDTFREDVASIMSGPLFKEYSILRRYPNATPSQYAWLDGDTVRTAFGQSDNNYTVATMAKYIATLASGGERMQLHLLSKIETQQGELIRQFEPVVETVVEMKPETLAAVYEGMILVTEGSKGTARSVFAGFPVRVAGKTGTAQEIEGRNDHSSFGGFAPYDNPQISVYVLIPFGDTSTMTASAATVAKKVVEMYMDLEMEPERMVYNNSLAR